MACAALDGGFDVLFGDGTADDIVVDYTPVSAAKCKAYTSAGAALTVASISAGTKTITLSAAPASGTVVTVLYECTAF